MTSKKDFKILLFRWFIALYLITICVDTKETKYCSEPGCYGDSCKKIPCENGECDDKGRCVCKDCYIGAACDQKGNKHIPFFLETFQDVKIMVDHPMTLPVVVVKAVDEDAKTCTSQDSCPCADIKYSLVKDNRNTELFSIDAKTGELFAKEPLEAIREKTKGGIYLTVSAENQGYDGYGRTGTEATIHIGINKEGSHHYGGFKANYADNGYVESLPYGDDLNEVHNREKRAVIDTIAAGSSPNVSFHLSKMGMYENVTEMTVGSRIRFQLAIHFPPGTTDMLVELFTPDNDTTVMILCDVQVTSVGSGLLKDGATVTNTALTAGIVMETKSDSSSDTVQPQYDRAIINMGNVTNNHNSGGMALGTEMIVLEWTAIMIENNQTQDNTVYWVSAGAEYNGETEIWVGQASFTTNTSIPVQNGETPTFNFTGPTEVQAGAASVFRVDMFIPYASVDLSVDVFAPLNYTNVMSVCNILVVDTGDHYSCIDKDKVPSTYYDAQNGGKGKERGHLALGKVTNAGFMESEFSGNPEYSRISVEFTMFVYDESANIDQEHWVGAAVEIGTSQIWAGQMKVKITQNGTLTSPTPTPTVKLTTQSSTNVSIEESVMYELNVSIPMSTVSTYEIEVLAPYNDSAARMSICKLELVSQGSNVPCINETSPVMSSRDGSNITDRAVMSLGVVRNTGQKQQSADLYANVLTFKVIMQVLNHTLNVDQSKLWLTVGVLTGPDKLWVGQNAVSLTVTSSSSSAAQPEFDMNYAFGSDALEIGAAANILVTMTTKANSMYTPMNMEFISPYENGSAVMKICRVEIVSNGQNLPCFNREKFNSSMIYTSKNGSNVYDKASVSLGAVSNVKTADDNQTTEDNIVFSVVAQMLNHDNNINGTKRWMSAGVSYTSTNIWVGQLASYSTTFNKAAYSSGKVPYFFINRTDTSDNIIYRGRTAVHSLMMKLPPYSRADFTVKITVDAGLSVCFIRVKEVGRNFPCLDAGILGNYTDHAGSYYSETATLNFGPITNVGADVLNQNDTFDNNTVALEFIVSSYDTTVGAKNIKVEVDYNSGSPFSETLAMDVKVPTVNLTTTNETIPTFKFSVSGLNENHTVNNSIAKGQAVLFNLDINPTRMSSNDLIVKFLTPVNQTGVMEVCSVYVVYAGKNIPCLKKQALQPSYQTRNIPAEPDHKYLDIGEINLGNVCQFPIDETNPEENKVTVQAVAKVTRNNTLSAGDQVWFSSTVSINADQIYVTQLALTIQEEATFENFKNNLADLTNANLSRIYVNVTTSPMEMYPGMLYDLPLVLNIPENISVKGHMDVRLPVGESAVMTINHIEVTNSGTNLGCLASNFEREWEETLNSTLGTTQKDYAMFDMGIVTNSGITSRVGTYTEEDDLLQMNIQLQMADAKINVADSEHSLSAGFYLGGTIFIIQFKVMVKRTNEEKPDMLLTANVTNSSELFTTSDMVTIDALLKHTNLSTAEGYNVSANFFFPEFLSFLNVESINLTMESVNDAIQGNGLQFKFSHLYFTDIVAFTFTLKVNSSFSIPFTNKELNATTPFGAAGNMIYRPGHINASETWFMARLDKLSFGVLGPGGVGCDAIPLGMKDGSIQDCQIDGSHSPNQAKQPKDGRLDGSSEWEVGTRAGVFVRYLQVNFGNMTKVTEVKLKHPPASTMSRVKNFQMMYSDDGLNWNTGETVTAPISYSTATLTLTSPVESRYIRMDIVDSWNSTVMPTLQAEFSGCTSTSDKSLEQVCAEKQTSWDNYSPATQLYQRGFLATASHYYFCDANPFNGDNVECFSRVTGTNVWSAMDETLVTILGYSSTKDELFGVALDKKSFMLSSDNGQSWASISQDYYTKVKAEAGWTDAQKVEYIRNSQFTPDNLVTQYKYGSFEARYGGIWDSTTQVTNWGTCC